MSEEPVGPVKDQCCIVLTLHECGFLMLRTLDGNDDELNATADDLCEIIQAIINSETNPARQ